MDGTPPMTDFLRFHNESEKQMLNCVWPTVVARSWLDIIVWLVGLVTASCGVFKGLREAKMANQIRRAELLRKLLNRYFSNEIADSINAIDENKVTFSYKRNFSVSEEANKSISLAEPALLFFSNVCYLKDNGLLSPKEFELFEWRLKKVMSNQSVSDYVRSLVDSHGNEAMSSLLIYCPQSTSEEVK